MKSRPLWANVVCLISVALILLYLLLGAVVFAPRASYGLRFDMPASRVTQVVAGGPAARAGVAPGDKLHETVGSNLFRAWALRYPHAGDKVAIETARGTVDVGTELRRSDINDEIASFAALASATIVLGFATLLCLRRPGVMAFAFWLYAASSVDVGDLGAGLAYLPAGVAVVMYLLLGGFVGFAFAVPLIPFALRYPNGRLAARARPVEIAAWICYGLAALAGIFLYAAYVAGTVDLRISLVILYAAPALPLPLAALILIGRYRNEPPEARAQTAWAIAGFIGAIAFTFVEQAEGTLAALPFNLVTVDIINQVLALIGNLFPLLAIYPILRFRLFDLGFVVNRAALYSLLTLGAVGSLAAVNWLAQRLITERLAFVAQPVAAIVIGIGFMRVRAWTQSFLERTVFRERWAAELELDRTMRAFEHAEGPEALDEALVLEPVHALKLHSAALFRQQGEELVLVANVGWEGATLARVPRDDRLVQRALAGERVIDLPALHWNHGGLPAAPNEPVSAYVLERGTVFSGLVFYGRHLNGTEIDPEESALLCHFCDAAATAYRTAELQAENQRLQRALTVLAESPAR